MRRSLPPTLAAVLILAGCNTPLPDAAIPLAPMSGEEQAVAEAIADVIAASRESFDQSVAGNPESVDPGYHTLGLADPPAATTEAGCYTGPFPAPGALPGNYKVRPAGGWLQINPASRNSGEGLGVTSTYWTPDGTTQASAAQTIEARMGDNIIQDLYVSPNTVVSDLPAFFKDKLALPASYQVLQAEETYKVYNNGALSGPATGYRWLVLDGERQSWVRALHVTRADGSAANHFNISANYASVGGSQTPLHIAYATQLAGSGIGYGFVRDTDLATGKTTGKGTWTDTTSNAGLDLGETTESDGTITRTLTRTLDFGETLTLTEHYAAHDKAGTGTIAINDVEVGTMSWNNTYKGVMTIQKGQAPYTASRAAAAQRPTAMGITMRVAIPDYPSPAPSEAPSAAPTEAPTAVPTDAPTAAPTEAPTTAPTAAPTPAPTVAPTATPTPRYFPPYMTPIQRARMCIRYFYHHRRHF